MELRRWLESGDPIRGVARDGLLLELFFGAHGDRAPRSPAARSEPSRLAAGSVWVANQGSGTVVRVAGS
jgi:hypothetical protein